MNNLNLLPPCMQYADNLLAAVRKFKITMDQARNLYGQYTIKEWNELLTK